MTELQKIWNVSQNASLDDASVNRNSLIRTDWELLLRRSMLFDQIDAVAQTEIAHSSEEARWFEDVRQRKHEHAVRDEFDDNNSISHEKCVHLLYQIRSALVDLWKNEREKTEWWMNSGE